MKQKKISWKNQTQAKILDLNINLSKNLSWVKKHAVKISNGVKKKLKRNQSKKNADSKIQIDKKLSWIKKSKGKK